MSYKIAIKGVGSYLPPDIITNQDIEKNVDTTDEWITSKLGIKERRVSFNDSVSDLGYKAAVKALDDANLTIDDIDLIIVSTSSPSQISPSTSCIIHNKFSTNKNIPCFDMNAVCAGFVYALTVAGSLISTNTYNNVLVIATEAYSNITNWNDRHCVFFGDGAGALVLGKSDHGWMKSLLEANGGGTGLTGFIAPLNEPFVMRGREVWDQAIKVLPESINKVLEETNTDISEIKMLFPHQPNINILKKVSEDINLPIEKVKIVLQKYGNVASASIPIALDEAIKENEIKEGDKILLSSIGSGWAWGSILIQYKK
jgi:3-oxoacyl-[acyl-carrier-protein] synthase-3